MIGRTIVLLLGAMSLCAFAEPERPAVGWSVDSPYQQPTHYYVLIQGPAAQVADAVEGAKQFGWEAIDRAESSSGTAFALLAGSVEADEANEHFFDWIVRQPVRQGVVFDLGRRIAE